LLGAGVNNLGGVYTVINNLQNYPEIMSIDFSGGSQVDIAYKVPIDPENSAYPLTIEFFGSING